VGLEEARTLGSSAEQRLGAAAETVADSGNPRGSGLCSPGIRPLENGENSHAYRGLNPRAGGSGISGMKLGAAPRQTPGDLGEPKLMQVGGTAGTERLCEYMRFSRGLPKNRLTSHSGYLAHGRPRQLIWLAKMGITL
jgi:hypothetical protein